MKTRSAWRASHSVVVAIVLALAPAAILTGDASAKPFVVEVDQSPFDPPPNPPPGWNSPVFSIQRDGVFIAGRRVTDETLKPVLTQEFRRVSGYRVFVRADAEVTYGEFLRVCRLVEAAGFKGRVRLMNEDIN
ncbi:MAG: hypothetical protein HY859_12960 [Caulobacterales bacterium]|nr:hypothetical protein [Caulobacterales bacterium]